MKLKDVNGTAINPDKIPVINSSAINTDKFTLTLVLGTDRYMFTYLKLEDLIADYEKIYTIVEGIVISPIYLVSPDVTSATFALMKL